MKDIDKFRGCLIGGAAGDALGYAVAFNEFMDRFNDICAMRYTTGMSENCKKRAGHHNSIPSKNSLIETLKICARARSSDTLIL